LSLYTKLLVIAISAVVCGIFFSLVLPMIVIVAIALLAGVLIGCIGIGGVFLVPCLTFAGGGVPKALRRRMFSFFFSAALFRLIFSGALGVWLYARHGSIEWNSSAWLAAGAAPGAFFGSVLSAHVRGEILLVLIGATVVFAGWRVLHRQSAIVDRRAIAFEPLLLVGIGAAVGIGSALTGTGGPVLLVPLLLW